MIVERSVRTTITCTPVCGPGPVRYLVSVPPLGCAIWNAKSKGRPGSTAFVGSKCVRWNVRAAAIVGAAGREDDDEHALTARAAATGTRSRPIVRKPLTGDRIVCRRDRVGESAGVTGIFLSCSLG